MFLCLEKILCWTVFSEYKLSVHAICTFVCRANDRVFRVPRTHLRPMTENIFEATARRYEEAAIELEMAVKHLAHTVAHFRNKDVPRASAHTLATLGHMKSAQVILDEMAVQHASKARV
jgi:hypothetical protein